MSKLSKAMELVSGLLGGTPKVPAMPKAELPVPPAPNTVTDTGASVAIGTTTDVKNQRVSGRSVVRKASNTQDVLGGLGRSGLNI